MQIDDKRLLGNYGTNLVAALLSRYCMVRQVPEETDIGIDLLCETLIKSEAKGESAENPNEISKGFLHFWVQVKSGRQVKQPAEDIAKVRVETAHVQYWLRQPVPVFVFMVPCKKPSPKAKRIYVVEINLGFGEVLNQETDKCIDIQSDLFFEPDDHTKWRFFLEEIVKKAYVQRIYDLFGIIPSLPYVEQRNKATYMMPSYVNPRRTLIQVFNNLSLFVSHEAIRKLTSGEEPTTDTKNMYKMLSQLSDRGNATIKRALALWSAIIEGDIGPVDEYMTKSEKAIKEYSENTGLSPQERDSWYKEIQDTRDIIEKYKAKSQ